MGNKNTEKKKRRLARKKLAQTQSKDKECTQTDKECTQCGELLIEWNTYSSRNTVCKYCEMEDVEHDIACYFD